MASEQTGWAVKFTNEAQTYHYWLPIGNNHYRSLCSLLISRAFRLSWLDGSPER